MANLVTHDCFGSGIKWAKLIGIIWYADRIIQLYNIIGGQRESTEIGLIVSDFYVSLLNGLKPDGNLLYFFQVSPIY